MAWSATPLRQYPENHDFGKAFNEDIVGKVMWLIVLTFLFVLWRKSPNNPKPLDRSV